MADDVCWGIFRERAHSPGRETDDEQILRLTAEKLESLGYGVRLLDPAADNLAFDAPQPNIFMMCERVAILDVLARYEGSGGTLVNAPSAVFNTYRERMAELLCNAGVPFPQHRFVPTDAPSPQGGPLWVKRGDVHNTQTGDVVFVSEKGDVNEVLAEMAGRGIERAMLQRHIDGDLIKFYGVGDPSRPADCDYWFRWFYHKDQNLAGHRFDENLLKTQAADAAAAIGLEVFGGDAIATPDNQIFLIDINAWPSFALFRDEASQEIAAHLASRFSRIYTAKRA
ncbi:MAG: hypothetical protein MJE12_29750 [Alphaproteobacteria bacterium]|nr:hypothetical protein [Alphaproteobacteria bacterium]